MKRNFYQVGVFIVSVLMSVIFYKVVYFTGGTTQPYPHFFYFVILFASMFGSWFTSLFTAILSSFFMSYWMMPLSVAEQTTQSHFGWTFRSFMFIVVAVFVKITTDSIRKNQDMLIKKTHQLNLFQHSAFNAMLNLAETKDPDTTGKHLERLAHYAEILLNQLDISQEMKQDIIQSIAFHDIGKVAIPDYILQKPGKLTFEEFEIMKKHTIIGGNILQSIEESIIDEEQDLRQMLQTARELTFYHHERPDGTGYPFGLKNHEIPLAAKITALCDVYDALSTKRPYKEPFPHDMCVQIIKEGRGTQFDEEVVDCFLAVEQEFKFIAEKLKDEANIGLSRVG
ncbi:MAG: HD-GYP domain-containing protein [Bacillota bacterium]